MAEETTPKVSPASSADAASDVKPAKPKVAKVAAETTVAETAADTKPAAKPKKEKAPAVEDKPFAEFIPQDYLPAIGKAFTALGISDLQLDFVNQTLPVRGLEKTESWQVVGSWARGQRQFNLYFLAADIQGQRAFSCTDNGTQASILEPFLGDERKVTLDLLVFGLMQRLNGQKWLARN